MRCSKAEKLIILKLDNELNVALASKLEKHLTGCSRCKALATEYSLLQSKLNSIEPVEFPSWVHHRILDSVKTHESSRQGYRRKWRLQAIPVTMAVLASIYMGVLIGNVTFMPETKDEAFTEYVTLDASSILYYDSGETHE